MKMLNKSALLILAALLSSPLLADDDDCYDPVDSWQPKEQLQAQLEAKGWQVERIRVDDGCYEAEGRDTLGNYFEAKYAPASLQIRELEIRFTGEGAAEDYLDQ
ncbi:PepSY domain-containing protein [Marinospirillum perlucidum]|uniref:PepSY domain-containing protein n=1 Tax=Marinospirillum perlucidum TaxID=1982602 RepID=UPI000DF34FBE|nr:PepSY domain-containing protein [Marinospirillum perlucidum]